MHDLVVWLRAVARCVDRADRRLRGWGAADDFAWWRRGGCRGRDGSCGRRSGLARGFDAERDGNDGGDVGIRTVHLDRHPERLAQQAHCFKTLLVVWPSSADKDPDIMSNQTRLVLLQGTDDAFEGCCNICKVGNATTDDEYFALRVRLATSDKVDCEKVR